MKNKTFRLLLSIVFLGFLIVILTVIIRSRESSRNTLPLNEVWTFQADDRILATPILIDDQIIFRTADKIYSISAVNGNVNWETLAKASDITTNGNYIGQPIVGNSKFLISEEEENSIGVYLTNTGEKLWAVAGQLSFINALEIVDDAMIVSRHDKNLVVYNLTSHQELWEVAFPPRAAPPIAANKDLVILGVRDVLRVYALKDGRLLNKKTFAESLIGEIALNGSTVFVSHAKAGGIWTISSLQLASLAENWAFQAGEINHPYLSATSKYLSLSNLTLILLDVTNGNVIWRDDSQKYYSVPAFHEDDLFFLSVQRMFSNNKEICKTEIRKDTVKDCSVVDRTGRLVTSQSYLPGPLTTNDLLIVPRDSEITAYTMP